MDFAQKKNKKFNLDDFCEARRGEVVDEHQQVICFRYFLPREKISFSCSERAAFCTFKKVCFRGQIR